MTILKKLFCLHKWEELNHIIRTADCYDQLVEIGHDYLYTCTECGKMKKVIF